MKFFLRCHLRFPDNILTFDRSPESPRVNPTILDGPVDTQLNSKKRKIIHDNELETRKRVKQVASLSNLSPSMEQSSLQETVPLEQTSSGKKSEASMQAVDEDEWAAFEADIAESERIGTMADAVISAPPVTAEDIKRKSREEEYILNKEKEEEELKEEKEDAARKIEEELEKMAILEAKVNRLRARREELRKQKEDISKHRINTYSNDIEISPDINESEDEDDDVSEDDEIRYGYRINR